MGNIVLFSTVPTNIMGRVSTSICCLALHLAHHCLGVLIRFREHPVAVSGDIKVMFHQVFLLPEDRPLLRFLWLDLKVEEPPKVFELQRLPSESDHP